MPAPSIKPFGRDSPALLVRTDLDFSLPRRGRRLPSNYLFPSELPPPGPFYPPDTHPTPLKGVLLPSSCSPTLSLKGELSFIISCFPHSSHTDSTCSCRL